MASAVGSRCSVKCCAVEPIIIVVGLGVGIVLGVIHCEQTINIMSVVTQTILFICICVSIGTMLKLNVDENADVLCEV